MHPNELQKYLAAFADGELDVEQNLQVLEYLKMNRSAADRVTHQQQLRELIEQCVRRSTPDTPPALRDWLAAQLEALEQHAAESPAPGPRPAIAGRVPFFSRLLSRRVLAIAAVIALVAALAVMFLNPPAPGNGAAYASITLPTFDRLERRHNRCARNLETLHTVSLTQDLRELPDNLRNRFGPAFDPPDFDLSAIGYQFKGIGNCGAPGKGAVHLIYYPIGDPTGEHAVSLWTLPYDASVPLEPDRLYEAVTPQSSAHHRVLLWRRGAAVYYLLGDTAEPFDRVATTMHSAR